MQEIDEPNLSETENNSSKKRKMAEKLVVTVKIQENDKKQQKHEGPPSDCWSWRKYGQKPIKGSPYPRGYYRCSTSKGCSAKKQVERSKTDASMLIITYTCTHNHPGPDFSPELKLDPKKIDPIPTQPTIPKQEDESEQPEPEIILMPEESAPADNAEDSLPYSQSPFNSINVNHQEDNPCDFQENMEGQSLLYNGEDPKSSTFSGGQMEMLKQEENDFYDELEELPTSSFFTAFMRNSFCGESAIVNPSLI